MPEAQQRRTHFGHICVWLLTKHGRAACHLQSPPLNLTHFPFRWVVLNSTHHLLCGGSPIIPGPLWREGDPGDSFSADAPGGEVTVARRGQPLGSLHVPLQWGEPGWASAFASGRASATCAWMQGMSVSLCLIPTGEWCHSQGYDRQM